MNPNPRQAQLVEQVQKLGTVSVEALAEQFGVTLQTVRRDVKLLSDAGLLPVAARAPLALATQVILAVALAAGGLETALRRMVARGWRPMLLGGIATAFIASSTLALVLLLGGSRA